MKKHVLFSAILLSTLLLSAQNVTPERWVAFSEDFDEMNALPEGWFIESSNQSATWGFGEAEVSFSTIDSDNVYSAVIASGDNQDEWLISPEIAVPENAMLTFYAMFNWSTLPVAQGGNTGATIQFMMSVDGGDWQIIWDANTTPAFDGYQWKRRFIDMYDYANQTVQLAWVVTGSDGGNFAVDGINMSVSFDNDIALVPTMPFDGIFNFVQIPLPFIETLNEKLDEYFSQITPDISFYQSKIQNNGINTAYNARLEVYVNGELVGATEPMNLDPGVESEVVGIPSLLDFQLGTNIVSYEVSMDDEDDYPTDNFASQRKEISESLYAVDSVKSFDEGLDVSAASNLFAVPTNTYVINGLSMAFSEQSNAGDMVRVSLYFYQNADNIFYGTEPNLGAPFFTYYIPKTDEMIGGFGDIVLPSMRFPQFGTYLLMIEDVDGGSLDICYDETDVRCYTIEDGDVVAHSGFGAIANRMYISEIPTSTCAYQVSNLSVHDNCDGNMIFSWQGDAETYLLHIQYMQNGVIKFYDVLTEANSVALDFLEEDLTYSWSVMPYNEDGVSGAAVAGEQFTYSFEYEAINYLSYDVTYNTVSLLWNAPQQSGLSGYEVYRDGSLIDFVQVTNYQDVNVNEVVVYGVRAKYYDNCYSEMFEVTVDAICDMPTDIYVDTDVPNTVSLSWMAAAEGASYYVYRDGNLLTETPIIETKFEESDVNAGDYIYSVTAYYETNDCESEALECRVKVFDGIHDVENSVSVYPNPVDDFIIVEGNAIEKIAIYSVLGETVYVNEEKISGSHKIDVSALNSGVYIVYLTTENTRTEVVKVVVK